MLSAMTVRIRGVPMRRLTLLLRVIQQVTLFAGVCLLLWPLFVSAESLWAQWSGERELALAKSHQPETIVVRKSGTPRSRLPRGSVVGRFEVPRLKLAYVLLEGTDNRTLDKSIGHVEGTGIPGEPGNIGIAGHRNTHFRKIEWIRRGDEIVLTSPQGQFRYLVEWARLFRPDDIAVLDSEHGPAVTLVTCFPFEYVGSAPLRYIVRALPDTETRTRLQSAVTSRNTQVNK
jgi:sortase A